MRLALKIARAYYDTPLQVADRGSAFKAHGVL